MSFIGACLGGLTARLIYHPFDTSRVNLQLKHSGPRSSIFLTREIFRENGLLYLYSGLGLSCIGSILGTGVYISSYNAIYNKFEDKISTNSMKSALIAECLASLIFVPTAVATERAQVKREISEYRIGNSFKILANIVKTGDLKALFKGYWLTLGVFVPLSIIQMPLYENIKNMLQKFYDNELTSKLIASAMSGGVAWWITSPLDIIRFRLQIQNAETNFNYKGLLHVLQG